MSPGFVRLVEVRIPEREWHYICVIISLFTQSQLSGRLSGRRQAAALVRSIWAGFKVGASAT
jgi:hypothetical protein